MRSLIRKLDHFVLDRWAVSRPDSLYSAGIERRPVEISSYDVMRYRSRVGNPAGDLFHVELTALMEIQAEYLIL